MGFVRNCFSIRAIESFRQNPLLNGCHMSSVMGFRPKRHEIFSYYIGMLFCCLFFSDIICRLCVGSNFNSPQKLLKYYRLLHFEEHRHGNFSLKSSANFLELIIKALILPIKTVPRIHLGQPKIGGN
jgi:hypothetical protein